MKSYIMDTDKEPDHSVIQLLCPNGQGKRQKVREKRNTKNQKILYAMLGFISLLRKAKQLKSKVSISRLYVAYHGCFVQICFLSKLKLFSMHYKFYDSFIIIFFFSNGLVHYYLGYKSFR
jgi:hypothetical protein